MLALFGSINNNAGILFGILLILVVLLFLWTFVIFRQWAMLRRNLSILKRGGPTQENMAELVSRHVRDVQELSKQFDGLMQRYDYLLELLQGTVQRVALVRYDAFEDMGGKLSYSVAILDDNGDGVLMSSIYARNENRTYAKPVRAGASPHVLSREEEEALKRAFRSKPKILRSAAASAPRPFDVEDEDLSEFESVKGEDETWVM